MIQPNKTEIWNHQGKIRPTAVRRKFGCDRILVEFRGRRNLKGTDLMAISELDPATNKWSKPNVMPVWIFAWYHNQKKSVIVPMNFLETRVKKNSYYRIVQEGEGIKIWHEAKAKFNKIGQPFENNSFVLVYE